MYMNKTDITESYVNIDDRKNSINSIKINTDISNKNFNNSVKKNKQCHYLQNSCPLIFKNLRSKLFDHLLLGGEHSVKVTSDFNSPTSIDDNISSDEKKEIVLADPKFGMFSLFKYHVRTGYLNRQLKLSNKVFCSHIFSLAFALPILIFFAQWLLYFSLISHEVKIFDGNYCPNKSPIEKKLIISGIGILYFVRSFFIWDNLTTRIGLQKTNRADNICAILDTFQEFMFTLIVYGANLWIIFVEDDVQNMLLNSLAMEFLMQLDNEFEQQYFENLPGAAEDIYDNIFVTYGKNTELILERKKKSKCFKYISYSLFVPYKILVITLFLFPMFCFFFSIAGAICK